MARLIDADALMESIKTDIAYSDYEWATYSDDLIERICKFPTIDAIERKRGEWETDGEWAKCSVCGYVNVNVEVFAYDGFKFCPNCGASMREREDE